MKSGTVSLPTSFFNIELVILGLLPLHIKYHFVNMLKITCWGFFKSSLKDMFDFRDRGRWGRERDSHMDMREKHWSVAFRTCPYWGQNPQPRYVPWPGIEPTTFWCTRWHSNQRTIWSGQLARVLIGITLNLIYNFR